MNSKKIVKIISVLMIIATIACAVSMVFANIEIPSATSEATTGLTAPAGKILGVVTYVCYAAAVIMLVVLGIKFISAAPDAKAEIKKSAVIYLVGALLVFAAGALLKIIQNVATSVAPQS